jgi:hypothetical protein
MVKNLIQFKEIKFTNNKMSTFDKKLGGSVDDIVHEFTRAGFSHKDERKAQYEYETVEQVADQSGTKEFKHKLFISNIVKDIEKRKAVLNNLLMKRRLTSEETAELAGLLNQKKKPDTFTYENQERLDFLQSISFNGGEEMFVSVIKGINKCYPIKDAITSLSGDSYQAWNGELITRKSSKEIRKATIIVSQKDPIDHAIESKSVLVVNGSSLQPGGVWERDDQGLEEQLWLRSIIQVAIDEEINTGFYPLKNETCVYTPKVLILRQQKPEYRPVDGSGNPTFIPVITVGGAHVSQASTRGLSKSEVLRQKIENLFAIAYFMGHNSIVCNAIGCYDQAPPEIVAQLFVNTIFGPNRWFEKFTKIIFSIPTDVIPITTEEIHQPGKVIQRVHDKNKAIYQAFNTTLSGLTSVDANVIAVEF